MDDRAQVSRAAIGILGTRAAVYPLKIIVTLIVAPLLGTASYGIYVFLILPGAVLMPLMAFGIGNGIRYYISNNEHEARDVGFMALLLGLFNGLITVGLFVALWRYGLLGETGDAISFDLLLPVLLVLPIQGAGMFMSRVMVGASWFSALNLYILLNNVLPPLFLIGFVIIAGHGVGGAVAALVASHLVLGLFAIIMVGVKYKPRIRFEGLFLGKASRYGFRSWVGTLANKTSVSLDQFVLGIVQSPDALGVYRIAVMVAELLWVIPDSVSVPLFNRVSKTQDLSERITVVMRSHRVLIFVISVLGVAIFAACWWLLPWVLGIEYLDARWILGVLVPGAVMIVTGRILGMYFAASGQPEKGSFVEVVGAVSAIAAYLALIPWIGVAGAAIGTTLSYGIIAFTARYMFVRSASPHPVSLYGPGIDDLRWASGLIRDSFDVWREKLGGKK